MYVSGDNASLDVVRAVAGGLGPIDVAVLFAGGAKTALLGDAHLTLSAAGAADAVRILGRPRTVVVHIDGWTHVTEPLATVRAAFATAVAWHGHWFPTPARDDGAAVSAGLAPTRPAGSARSLCGRTMRSCGRSRPGRRRATSTQVGRQPSPSAGS